MEIANNNLSAPKTVSADPMTVNNTVASSSIRFTCDAVIKFENDLKSSSRAIDLLTGKSIRIFPKGSIEGLKEGAQSYYDRALIAESKCKTSLYGGLAGGAAITVGVIGLVLYFRKRNREKKQEESN